MGFPKAIAAAQRQSLTNDIIEALDLVEPIHRSLDEIGTSAHLVDLSGESLAAVSHLIDAAYKSLAKARQIAEEGA